MSQPTRGDVHVNRPLSNISVAFIQSEADFVASRVFPVVPVAKQSDRYFQYDRKQWFRSNARKRAPGSESAGGGFDIDNTPSYFADVWAVHKDVDDQTRANADVPLNLDRDATRWVTQQQLLRKELEFVSTHFQTGIWTGSSTGTDIVPGTKWDAAGSDPVDDILLEKESTKEKTAFMPNTIVVTPQVHRALKSNASILDRVKHTQFASITEDMLARLFEVDKYMVARATRDKNPEGAAEDFEFVFGTEQMLLVYSNPSPSILTPSGGYTFAWTGLFGAAAAGARIKRFRMEMLASDRIESEMAWDQKLVAPELGVFFNDILT